VSVAKTSLPTKTKYRDVDRLGYGEGILVLVMYFLGQEKAQLCTKRGSCKYRGWAVIGPQVKCACICAIRFGKMDETTALPSFS
jgi:hypothetical protein